MVHFQGSISGSPYSIDNTKKSTTPILALKLSVSATITPGGLPHLQTKTLIPRKLANEPWMTNGLLNSSRKCDKLYKKVCGLEHVNPKHLEYKKYRNIYNGLKRKAKLTYYRNKIEQFRHNSKKLWGVLRDITGKTNDKTGISDTFLINGKTVTDPSVISNNFCDFYSSMCANLARKIAPPKKTFKDYLPDPCDASLFLIPTHRNEVLSIIKKMKSKTSTGYDGISNNLLKAIGNEISTPLAYIFNKSLKEGVFPESMKTAKVPPVYKSKDKKLFVNYRPVSLLPVISKVLEKIVHKRLYSFLTKKLLLYDSQFGFRNNHSTIDAILEFVGKVIKGFERGEYTLAVFLDLSKAFDSLEHSTLLEKLYNFGIRGIAHDWFKSYLQNRKMYVKYNNNSSETQEVNFGVPQGSVLGPLLYIMLTNDLAMCLKKCRSVLYADDTTVYATNKNLRVLKESM